MNKAVIYRKMGRLILIAAQIVLCVLFPQFILVLIGFYVLRFLLSFFIAVGSLFVDLAILIIIIICIISFAAH